MKFSKLKIIIVIFAAAVLTSCSKNTEDNNIQNADAENTDSGEYETLEIDGVLYSDSTYEYSLPISSTISEILVREGEFVEEDDLLYTVDYSEYLTNQNKFENEFNDALEYSNGVYKVITVSARSSGYVFNLTAEDGLNLYDEGGTALCTVAMDRMAVDIESDSLKERDMVTVVVNGEENTGSVKSAENGTAVIEITKSYYGEGAKATVYSMDKSAVIGSGSLYYSMAQEYYYFEGYVSNVFVIEGQYVERDDKICTIYIPSSDMWDVYTDILATETGIIQLNEINVGDSVETIQTQYGCIGEITSDTNNELYTIQCPSGEIDSIAVEDGDEVEKGETILTVKSPSRKIQQNYANIEDYYTKIRKLCDYTTYGAVPAQQSGIVTNINYSEGSYVEAASAVISVSTTDNYYMSIEADIQYIDILTVGKEVGIAFTNNMMATGYIAHIDYNVNNDMLNIRISVPTTDEIEGGDIVPGMTGIVEINY